MLPHRCLSARATSPGRLAARPFRVGFPQLRELARQARHCLAITLLFTGSRLPLALAFGGLMPTEAVGAQAVTTAYQVKALFLLNFLRFVEWPATAYSDPSAPLIVGTLGDNPFGPLLRDALHGQVVRGRTLVFRELDGRQDPTQCHLLFISRSERDRLRGLLLSLNSSPTLTVSELDRFCEQGGMINLVTHEGSVRFEINPDALARARLRASAKLLSLAGAVVHPSGAEDPR